MSHPEYVDLSWLLKELDSLRKDHDALVSSYEILKARLHESREGFPDRTPPLETWSGMRAIMGSLEMSLHSVERSIMEAEDIVRRVERGEIRDTSAKSNLTVVRGDDSEPG